MINVRHMVTFDGENIGYGLGSGYKSLVFVISPFNAHVNLELVTCATQKDSTGVLQGTGKIHRHVKLRWIEQVQGSDLE